MIYFWRVKSVSSIIEKVRKSSLKFADMYYDRFFTVVPKDFDFTLGIFPEDQKFNSKYVLVWDSWNDLIMFRDMKKLQFILPHKERFSNLVKIGNGFALPYISRDWKLKICPTSPFNADY